MRILLKLFAIILVFASLIANGQTERQFVRKGNKSYEKGNYKDAEIDYRKALSKNPSSGRAQYNLGTSLYKQKNAEEAVKALSNVNTSEMDKNSRAKVYHNLGNSLLEAKKYPESIQAYKNALRNNPTDQDTRYNLAYAMKKLQQQQQQQQQKQGDKKDDKKQQQKDQQQQQQQKEQKEQQQKQQKQQISKADAEKMMEALKNNEKNTLEKLKKQNAKAVKVTIEKDW